MARGNLFLGMGRGSIGDVTFYRADGQQLSRVRNRSPRNPKTNPQLYQRAIMATVVKAYQAGKAIFDHAFQGYSVGAGCQRQFISLNAKMLRELVATDINTPLAIDEQKARVVAPGVSAPVANPFIISRGSYQQRLFSWDDTNKGFYLPALDSGGTQTVAQYAEDHGLIPGDIYTFVVFAERSDFAYTSPFTSSVLARLRHCNFGFVRMIVADNVLTETAVLSTYEQLFDMEDSGGDFDVEKSDLYDTTIGQPIDIATLCGVNGYTTTGAIGVIRSRFDQDLRSDSALQVIYGDNDTSRFGIASQYILQTWADGATPVGDSDLILEGGDV